MTNKLSPEMEVFCKQVLVLNTIRDSVRDLMFYDRKDDEELPKGMIEDMVKRGEITLDDMAQVFKEEMEIFIG